MSSFRWGMVACWTPRNSQVTVWELRQLLFSAHCLAVVFCCFASCFWLSCSGVYQHPSSFWSVTQSLLGVYQATISHVKRVLKYLSYGLKFIMFINQILIFWLNSYSKSSTPRTFQSHIKMFHRTSSKGPYPRFEYRISHSDDTKYEASIKYSVSFWIDHHAWSAVN